MVPRTTAIVTGLLLSAAAAAQDAGAPATDASGALAPPQTVTVFGRGQTRQVQNLTRTDLERALPGTSPLKLLGKLPGVQFVSADPYGAYEWSVGFAIRGFSQGQLGYTLDGIPLGDFSYANHNGLSIGRAIIAEDIARVTVSQGAGALGTASTSNLGGTVQFVSRDPAARAGADAGLSLGPHASVRSFARLDTGTLGASPGYGVRAAISLARLSAGKWKGDGRQRSDQFGLKLVQDLGPHRLSVFYDRSDRDETDYQDLSLEGTARLGWDWDNYAPDWQRAVDAARGSYRGAVNNPDDAYYLGRGLRRDALAGATLLLRPEDGTTLTLTAWHHGDEGQGHWYTPYTPSPTGVPVSVRTTEYGISRNGLLAALEREIGAHRLEAGAWTERSRHALARRYYAVAGPEDTDRFLRDPFRTDFLQDFVTRTLQWHVQDTVSLAGDALRVQAGFKSPRVHIDAETRIGNRAAGTIEASRRFLPQAGLRWEFAPGRELFASVARNMRAFQPGIVGPFQQTQAAFDANAGALRPETSTTVDLGLRADAGAWSGSVAAYRADFEDRIALAAVCAGILGCPFTMTNVGRVAMRGLEAAALWRFAPRWSAFGSLSLVDATYRDDYLDGGKRVAAAGKRVVDTPRTMLAGELAWDGAPWFGSATAKYTGPRYYTYLNDAGVPGWWLLGVSAGWRAKALGPLRDLVVEAKVENALDRRYYATIGTNGFAASDPAGGFATLQAGAPRQWFVTVRAGF